MIDVEIKNKKDCTGCHACFTICSQSCISMNGDREGFWYPNVNYNYCVKCGLCIDVCPIINKTKITNKPIAYACINKNEAIRLESSSGGVFTLIAEQIIDNGGIVFGAGFNEKFEVEHTYVETKAELDKFRGSKYVQSRIGDTYKQARDFLEQEREVLFSGTPCQIGGLKSYLGKFYKTLFCVDIICHGVPSPKVWEKYISYQESYAGSPTQRIDFRNKYEGWKRYSVSFLFKNGTEYRQTFDRDLYMRAFLRNVCLRPSCYECRFKTLSRQSDITLADFWGIQDLLREMDDDKGTSLIFVNSVRGQHMLKQIKDKTLCEEIDINQAVSYRSPAIKSVEYNPKRDGFFEEIDYLSFDELVKKYCSDKMFVRIKRKIILILRIVLKKLGLLSIVKRVLKICRS